MLLEADGGVRSAIVNATTLALIDAGIAMEDFVCACSAGSVQGALLLDLSAQEDNAGSELSVGFLPNTERISFVQLESKVPLTAMQERLSTSQLRVAGKFLPSCRRRCSSEAKRFSHRVG